MSASEMSRGLVSVIMPVYNAAPFLGETLPAVAAQTYANVERIAADDGSTDDSRERLAAQGGWQVVCVSRLGSNGARRAAIARSRGEYVALLDQDDLWHPEHLAECVAVLEAYPDASAAIGRRDRFRDRNSLRLAHRTGAATRYNAWDSFPFQLIDSPSMVVVRRTALERMGGWPEEGAAAADCLAWWRLSAFGPLAVTPGRTVGIRESAGSMSDVDRRSRHRCLENMRWTAALATESLPESRRSEMAAFADRILAALTDVVAALERGTGLEDAAHRWESALADQSDTQVLVSVRFLGWLLNPGQGGGQRGTDGPEWRQLMVRVLNDWPASAPRTGREMRRFLAVTTAPAAIAAALRSSLFQGAVWRCWVESLAARQSRRLGRVADPLDLRFEEPRVRSVPPRGGFAQRL